MADDLAPAGASGAVPNRGLSNLTGPSAGSSSDLAALLIPGAVISGRVIQGLGSDHYLLNMRGTTLVVTSRVPLSSDSVVRFQVINGGAQATLRMIDSTGQHTDQAQTSTVSARLQALGLPPTRANTLALAAFEKAGAPLARDPILAAATAIAAAAQSTESDTVQQAALAAAMAALARAGLPSTPATVALAMRALATALPNPASVLIAVTQALAAVAPAQVGSAGTTTPGGGIPLPPTGMPAPPPTPASPSPGLPFAPQTGSSSEASSTSAPPSSGSVHPDPSAPAARSDSAASPGSGPVVPSGSTPEAQPSTATIGARQASPIPASATGPTMLVPSATTSPSPTASAVGPGPVTSAPLQAAVAGITVIPTGSGMIADRAAVTVTVVDGGGPPLSASVPSSLTASAPPSPLLPGDLALRSLLAQGIPDATQGGAPAVMQALSWSGLRSSTATTAPGSLLKHLAAALPAVDPAGAPAATTQAAAAKAELTQALAHAVRETSAVTVIKPSALADYDVVMGVALTDQGKNTPTRLAVAARPAPGGTTTFLRVDTELSHIGPISVRISGLNEGPMAITLLADGGGACALAEALPGLADSLQQLGLLAGLRVASLVAEDGYGG